MKFSRYVIAVAVAILETHIVVKIIVLQ